MFCKNCGTKVEENWKVCPNCGSSLQGEEVGNTGNINSPGADTAQVKRKKPAYKKWWFWVVVFIVIIGAAMSGDDTESEKQEKKKEAVKDDAKNEKKEEEVTDFSNIDLEAFLEKTEDDIKNAGFREGEEYIGYGALEGDVQISVTDGEIDLIMINGEGDKTPSFHGVKPGMKEDEAYGLLADAYPEEMGDADGKMLANIETKRSVRCQAADGKITGITYMTLSDSDLEEYQQKKEEALRKEFVFPDSNTRYLSEDEVRSVEADKLAIGRNEIFARHGYKFKEKPFKKHFKKMSWYKGTVDAGQFDADAVFNDFEKKNVELIKKVEDEINGTAKKNAEQQQAIDAAYGFLVGRSFHLQESQPLMEFQSSEVIRYCWGGNIPDDYYNYSITARYEVYKDDLKEWMTFITIDGEEYYLRYFTNGTFELSSMSGSGKLEGWYEIYF